MRSRGDITAYSYDKKLIKELADKVLLDGLANSEDGSWVVFLDDIKEHIDSTINIDSGIPPVLVDELKERDEISEVYASEDCIQMFYVMQLNPNATPAELLSVVGYSPTMPEVLQRYVPAQDDDKNEDEIEKPDDSEEEQEEERGLIFGQN